MKLISNRDRAIWRAAITLANNMCVQDSNRLNQDDGSLEAVNALADEARRIRGWVEPTDAQLVEMFAEAGVPDDFQEMTCPVCRGPGKLQFTRMRGRPYISCDADRVKALLLEHHGYDPRIK